MLAAVSVLGAGVVGAHTCDRWVSWNQSGWLSGNCSSCDQYTSSSDGRCLECKEESQWTTDLPGLATDSSCACPEGYSHFDFIQGIRLSSPRCELNQQQPQPVRSCPSGFQLGTTGSCHPKGLLADWGLSSDSSVVMKDVDILSYYCKEGDDTDCEKLLNYCAIDLWDPNAAGCSAIERIESETSRTIIPKPKYVEPQYLPGKTPRSRSLFDTSTPYTLLGIEWDGITGEVLHGGYYSVTTEIFESGSFPSSYLPWFLKTGVITNIKSFMTASYLKSFSPSEAYNRRQGVRLMQLFMSYQSTDSDSTLVEPVSDRFVLYDAVSFTKRGSGSSFVGGYIRFVSDYRFESVVHRNGTFTRPVVTVSHGALPVQVVEAVQSTDPDILEVTLPDITFSIRWTSPGADDSFKNSIISITVILAFFCGLWSLVRLWTTFSLYNNFWSHSDESIVTEEVKKPPVKLYFASRQIPQATGHYHLLEQGGGFTWVRTSDSAIILSSNSKWCLRQSQEGEDIFTSSCNNNGSLFPNQCSPWSNLGNISEGTICVDTNAQTAAMTETFRALERYTLILFGTFTSMCSPLFAVILWLASCAYYLEFKHDTNSKITRSLPVDLGCVFYPLTVTTLCLSIVAILTLYRKQLSADTKILLLDWEVPKDDIELEEKEKEKEGDDAADEDKKEERKQSKKKDKPKSKTEQRKKHDEGNEATISLWRKLFVANELKRLMSRRTWRTIWCLFWVLWVSLAMGYLAITTTDTSSVTNRRSTATRDPVPDDHPSTIRTERYQHSTHPILRITLSGLICMVSSLSWWVLQSVYKLVAAPSSIEQFEQSVLPHANVSLLITETASSGWYLHGVSSTGKQPTSDVTMQQFKESEAATNVGFNNLPPPRVYQMFINQKVYKEIIALTASVCPRSFTSSRSRRSKRCFEWLHGVRVIGWKSTLSCEVVQKLQSSIKAVIFNSYRDPFQNYVTICSFLSIPPSNPFYRFEFGQPPQQQQQQATSPKRDMALYFPLWFMGVNVGPSWSSNVTLVGADSSIHIHEMIIFITIDALMKSTLFAVAVVCFLYFGGILLRRRASYLQLCSQAVDPRFLLS
eukprot:TRINITY_DN8306_c0_g1_i1.p1 TRINITY_DN8306_c0_g1~~TRINITY_DN8306_c0_g1_i1.p1  ORF type:complete len:1087 (+),score=199.09 TRINITY_DN8306_c0_g1_i1:112-3372(+)